MMKREKGSPIHLEERLEKEKRVYALLDELDISFERLDHMPLYSMEQCAEVDEALEAVICKNLFLHNSKKDTFYLLMLAGDKKFNSGEIANQIQSTRLSFASPEELAYYLDITPGAVSVMGLMNDKEHKVKLLVDQDLLQHEYFGCHPCVNTSSLRMRVKDLLEVFLVAIEHTPTFIKVEDS